MTKGTKNHLKGKGKSAKIPFIYSKVAAKKAKTTKNGSNKNLNLPSLYMIVSNRLPALPKISLITEAS